MSAIIIQDTSFSGLRGNTAIKAANQSVYTTTAEAKIIAEEIYRCMEDIVYFAENYFTIISDKGKEIISLYDKQKEVLEGIRDSKNSVILAARQSGKCVYKDTKISIKNKHTGIIEDITIGELYDRLK